MLALKEAERLQSIKEQETKEEEFRGQQIQQDISTLESEKKEAHNFFECFNEINVQIGNIKSFDWKKDDLHTVDEELVKLETEINNRLDSCLQLAAGVGLVDPQSAAAPQSDVYEKLANFDFEARLRLEERKIDELKLEQRSVAQRIQSEESALIESMRKQKEVEQNLQGQLERLDREKDQLNKWIYEVEQNQERRKRAGEESERLRQEELTRKMKSLQLQQDQIANSTDTLAELHLVIGQLEEQFEQKHTSREQGREALSKLVCDDTEGETDLSTLLTRQEQFKRQLHSLHNDFVQLVESIEQQKKREDSEQLQSSQRLIQCESKPTKQLQPKQQQPDSPAQPVEEVSRKRSPSPDNFHVQNDEDLFASATDAADNADVAPTALSPAPAQSPTLVHTEKPMTRLKRSKTFNGPDTPSPNTRAASRSSSRLSIQEENPTPVNVSIGRSSSHRTALSKESVLDNYMKMMKERLAASRAASSSTSLRPSLVKKKLFDDWEDSTTEDVHRK